MRGIVQAGVFVSLILLLGLFCGPLGASADEPNEFFGDSTVLDPGVLSVADDLYEGEPIDTLVGARGLFGDIEFFDDDSSPYGNGLASALYDVPTNSGEVSFVVSGVGDDFFNGDHGEAGGYEATVTVYDFFGDQVDQLSFVSALVPGLVEDFSFSSASYIGGAYDVELDNGVDVISDVDFFTFTGLTPGDDFSAETTDPDGFSIDTLLGWFDNEGSLLDLNDDIDGPGGDFLSRLEGVVPEDGELTFAVSGYGDEDFLGQHSEFGTYELVLTIDADLAGDFNEDGRVDAADYTVWRDGLGTTHTASQYDEWAGNYGAGVTGVAEVPEPGAVWLVAAGVAGLIGRRYSSPS